MPDSSAPVLVTGGSGFLAVHIIFRLLGDGRRVRATIRSMDRGPEVRATLEQAGADVSELAFVAADLTADDGWSEAVADCEYVLHVASPFPSQQPKDEADLIVPAREGTLRVLQARSGIAPSRHGRPTMSRTGPTYRRQTARTSDRRR